MCRGKGFEKNANHHRSKMGFRIAKLINRDFYGKNKPTIIQIDILTFYYPTMEYKFRKANLSNPLKPDYKLFWQI